jgi:hypothetical protein
LESSPAIYAARWSWEHPDRPVWVHDLGVDDPSVTILDLERLVSACAPFVRKDIKDAQRGRPRGVTSWSKDEFLRELPQARAAFMARHRRKPTYTELAAEMGIPKPTFDRYKRDFGTDQT